MIRLAWPAYTNEIVFLFHATALVYFTLPVINEQKDLMNKAGELFERDYNVFLHFSVALRVLRGESLLAFEWRLITFSGLAHLILSLIIGGRTFIVIYRLQRGMCK